MNRLLLARYRALVASNPYFDLKTQAYIEAYCDAVLSKPDVDKLKSSDTVEIDSNTILYPQGTSPIGSSACVCIFGGAHLVTQHVLKGRDGGIDADYSRAVAQNTDVGVSIGKSVSGSQSKADLLNQTLLNADFIDAVSKSKGIANNPGAKTAVSEDKLWAKSKASVLNQTLLNADTSDIWTESTGIVNRPTYQAVVVADKSISEAAASLWGQTPLPVATAGVLSDEANAVLNKPNAESMQTDGYIDSESNAEVINAAVGNVKAESYTHLESNARVDNDAFDMLKGKGEIDIFSNAKLYARDIGKQIAATVIELYSKAVLSVETETPIVTTWEYPVSTDGVLKITQAYSATQNNNILEVV